MHSAFGEEKVGVGIKHDTMSGDYYVLRFHKVN